MLVKMRGLQKLHLVSSASFGNMTSTAEPNVYGGTILWPEEAMTAGTVETNLRIAKLLYGAHPPSDQPA